MVNTVSLYQTNVIKTKLDLSNKNVYFVGKHILLVPIHIQNSVIVKSIIL